MVENAFFLDNECQNGGMLTPKRIFWQMGVRGEQVKAGGEIHANFLEDIPCIFDPRDQQKQYSNLPKIMNIYQELIFSGKCSFCQEPSPLKLVKNLL